MRTFRRRQSVSRTFVAILTIAFLWTGGIEGALAAASAAEQTDAGRPAATQADFKRLEGRWVRPDGGYVLELKSIKKDGSLTGDYSNSSISVFALNLKWTY